MSQSPRSKGRKEGKTSNCLNLPILMNTKKVKQVIISISLFERYKEGKTSYLLNLPILQNTKKVKQVILSISPF